MKKVILSLAEKIYKVQLIKKIKELYRILSNCSDIPDSVLEEMPIKRLEHIKDEYQKIYKDNRIGKTFIGILGGTEAPVQSMPKDHLKFKGGSAGSGNGL